MSELRPRDSYRGAFRGCLILPLQSKCIFSILMFVVNNMGLYYTTPQIHGLNTRHKFDLYRPQANLTIYQRVPYYFDIDYTMFYIYCKCCIDTVMYMGFHAELLLLYLYALF
jgi:hypothetical protein